MKKIFLSIPVSFRPELRMFFGIQRAIATSKHQIVLYATEGDSLISRARNNHISIFLEKYKDCDYFFSIDCDIEVENNKENDNIFDKLIDHDKDFVGGLYALKRQSEKRCASVRDDGSFAPPEFNSGLIKMKWLSSGCWCIKRSVIEKMANSYPELQYDGEGEMYGKKIYGLYIPFIKEIENKKNKYLSEDWAFIERWRSLGGEVYADTSIVLNHIGKYSYNLWK
jgi:hypothetical protein